MANELIGNSVVGNSTRSGNCVISRENFYFKQNDICVRNTNKVQSFKIVIDNEDQCKNIRQRSDMSNIASKLNTTNTTGRYNNHERNVTHILPHNQPIMI
jgi:hypothetical protein